MGSCFLRFKEAYQTNVVVVDDMKPATFRRFLDAIYQPRNDIDSLTLDELLDLLKAADRCEFYDLRASVAERLNAVAIKDVSADDIPGLMWWSETYRLMGLQGTCELFCERHGVEVLLSQELKNCIEKSPSIYEAIVKAAVRPLNELSRKRQRTTW